MNVLLITQYFPPEIGAAASRWGDYTKILTEKGHKVTVLCETPNYPRGDYYQGYKNKLYLKEIKSPSLVIIRSAAGVNDRKSTIKKIIHYLVFMLSGIINVMKIKNYDFVIVSSPPLFTGMIGVFLQKFKSVPFWLDLRDLWPDSAMALKQIKKNRIYFFGKKLESIIYNSATGFILSVPGFKNYIEKKYINQKHKPILPLINGVSNNFIKIVESKEIKPDKRFTVLYSGNMGLAQGLKTIIEVAKLVDKYPIDFRLIGNGVCRDKLESKVKQIDLKNVVFHDSVSRSELIKWIKKSSVCLVPLKNSSLFKTALPSKMFEYMACGRPVIVGIQGEAEEIIKISKAGIVVEPENPILLSKAIINYYKNFEQCISDGINGMRYITENLIKEDLISKLIDEIRLIKNNE